MIGGYRTEGTTTKYGSEEKNGTDIGTVASAGPAGSLSALAAVSPKPATSTPIPGSDQHPERNEHYKEKEKQEQKNEDSAFSHKICQKVMNGGEKIIFIIVTMHFNIEQIYFFPQFTHC